jgi:predicted nuclease with TOPRIM domain
MKITLKDGTEITLTVEGLLTLRDAETMAYLSYEANQLREQAKLDKFKFNELSIRNAELEKQVKELKRDSDILNAFLKTTGKEGVDLCKENIKLRNENIELHCRLSQLDMFSSIDKASESGENVTFKRIPVYEMTRHANGNTREQFMAQTWTDKLLVEFGYMKIKYQYVRSN